MCVRGHACVRVQARLLPKQVASNALYQVGRGGGLMRVQVSSVFGLSACVFCVECVVDVCVFVCVSTVCVVSSHSSTPSAARWLGVHASS